MVCSLSAQFVAASIWYIMLEFFELTTSLARPCAVMTVQIQNSTYLVSLVLVLCLKKKCNVGYIVVCLNM